MDDGEAQAICEILVQSEGKLGRGTYKLRTVTLFQKKNKGRLSLIYSGNKHFI